MLKVSASGYYDWRYRPPSKRAQVNAVLREHIRQAHRASDETYGMPRISAELAGTGVTASRKRIARFMRGIRIQGVCMLICNTAGVSPCSEMKQPAAPGVLGPGLARQAAPRCLIQPRWGS